VEVIGQDDNGIYRVVISGFTHTEAFSEQCYIIDEDRIATMSNDGKVIAVPIKKYSFVVCHVVFWQRLGSDS